VAVHNGARHHGPHAAALVLCSRRCATGGAIVTGIDKSAGMLELSRRRLGGDADLQVAELGGPLPFPDNTFEDVAASLVLHYLED
jgi:SAM-dependent methyltransferase